MEYREGEHTAQGQLAEIQQEETNRKFRHRRL